jgi:hypothetical protein
LVIDGKNESFNLNNNISRETFIAARDKVINDSTTKNGIGTLGEKTLHAVLKEYFEPDSHKKEIKISGYIADIASENGIIEIQTRDFQKIKRKLEVFLNRYCVTVIYPVAYIKWLSWIDIETGQVSKRRRSPKMATPAEVLPELYKIREFLTHPKLRIGIIMMEFEEYRLLNGWSTDKKHGSTRHERIPLQIFQEIYLQCPKDYTCLLPGGLPEIFTSKDFAKATRLSPKKAQIALKLLNDLGVVVRQGKQGNMYLYKQQITKIN